MRSLISILLISLFFVTKNINAQLLSKIDTTTIQTYQLQKDTTDTINFIKKIQLALQKQGFYQGEINGTFNITTKAALIKWCKFIGLPIQFISKETIMQSLKLNKKGK